MPYMSIYGIYGHIRKMAKKCYHFLRVLLKTLFLSYHKAKAVWECRGMSNNSDLKCHICPYMAYMAIYGHIRKMAKKCYHFLRVLLKTLFLSYHKAKLVRECQIIVALSAIYIHIWPYMAIKGRWQKSAIIF